MTTASGALQSASETLSGTSIASDVDLLTARLGYVAGDERHIVPRFLIAWNTGTLVVEYLNGEQDTIPIDVAGICLPVQPAKLIASGSTVTHWTVGY